MATSVLLISLIIFLVIANKKSAVLSVFREFEKLMTNQSGQSIDKLCDEGGENLSADFQNYLKSRGIRHQLAAQY